MKKLMEHIKPYSALAVCYLLAVIVLKLVEALAAGVFEALPRLMANNLIVASWTVMAVALLYLLLRRCSPRAATLTAAVLFAVLWLSELGLTLYAAHNGYLLGSELLARPLSETLFAIRGAMGLLLPLLLLLLVLALWVWLGLRLQHSTCCWPLWCWPCVALFALLALLFPVSHLFDGDHDTYIHNKTHYLFVDSWRYLRSDESSAMGDTKSVPYDEALLAALMESHPEWEPIDLHYPLERYDNTPDPLSPYFQASTNAPNVVLLIVESMGAELMGTGLMPFVDTLAATGLCWDNCLSTTTRSYGAMPALTGSLGGPKSFQFGNMPDHNSLISILSHAGYRTQAFYGGDFGFDRIYDYLQAQHIDYLSPFYQEYEDSKVEENGTWWGYHDGVMLRRTLEVLNDASSATGAPMFNIITTITMHEDLELSDKSLQQRYEQKSNSLTQRPNLQPLQKRGASALYTDDCLRQFFAGYAQRADFANTIFIITGDHATGLLKGNKLSFHHVPLIIWSPLLQSSARFSHLVTHNDLAPSLCRLLTNRYGVTMPPTVHWLSNGLDDSPKTMLVVGYSRMIEEMVWNGYYYQAGNEWAGEEVSSIDSQLALTPIHDDALLQRCRTQLQQLRYLYEYTYYNNRLTQHPLISRSQYTLYRDYQPGGEVRCVTPAEKPSAKGSKRFYLLPPTELKQSEDYNVVRLTLTSDVLVVDSLWQDNYMELTFLFDNGTRLVESDKISNYIAAERIHAGNTYHIEVAKEYPLARGSDNRCAVYVSSARYDDVWVPGSSLVFRNNKISIHYGK